MPSARDLVMRELAAIKELAEENNRLLKQILDEDDLFGEDDYDEDTFEEAIHEPRSSVMVKDPNGEEFPMGWNDLEERIQEAITISRQQGEPYQLYQDEGGKLRIMVANEVSSIIRKRHTPTKRRGDR